MSQKAERADMTKKPVLYRVPGMDTVVIRRDLAYRETDSGPLTMDLYRPPDTAPDEQLPAVIYVSGYSDLGLQAFLGCKLKDWESYIGWGKLTAASGMSAIMYSATRPAEDLPALMQHIRNNAESLAIDPNRLGLWACSGNGPMAVSFLMQEPGLRCAALSYAYTLDLDGASHIADAARTYGFANPAAGKSIADLPPQTPLFLARAGQDQLAHLNEGMDRFVAQALAGNLPLTLSNHPEGPHAFDLLHDSETTREIVRRTLAFLRFHLLA
jgi:acetyl esterase/lipase